MSVELSLLNALYDTRKDIKNSIKTTKKTPQDRGKEVKCLEDFCCNEILGLVLKIPK